MISAEIILDTRRKTKNGYPIKIRVYDSVAYKNGHRCRDYVNLKAYQDSEVLKLTSDLKRRDLDLIRQVEFCNTNNLNLIESLEIIKNGIPEDDIDVEIQMLEKRLELLKQKKGVKNQIGFMEFSDILIKEMSILNKPTFAHETSKKVVKKFISPLDDIAINDITREWLIQFDLYYVKKGLADSTIATYINMIRAVYKEAQKRESLNIKSSNPFLNLRNFQKNKVETELTIEDLTAIKDIHLDDIITKNAIGEFGIKRLADLFVFQFAIGGHDFVDIANLRWSNIINGRVKFKRFKNRFKKSSGEYVDNYLNDFCKNVIDKYGDRSNERIFSFIPDPNTHPKEYRAELSKINKHAYKSVSKNAGIKTNFSSKETRYLFRTIAGNLLIDSLVIMKLQGHTPNGVTFGYQGSLNHEVQDKEHKKILDLVFK